MGRQTIASSSAVGPYLPCLIIKENNVYVDGLIYTCMSTRGLDLNQVPFLALQAASHTFKLNSLKISAFHCFEKTQFQGL